MMRFVRTMMAVLLVLALGAHAHAQYGLYGAPSTLPLSPPQAQSTYPQNPPLYVDTATGTNPARPVVANSTPVYAQQAYANPVYGNPANPGVLPAANQVPYDPGYATPIVPIAAYQADVKNKTLPPPPVRAPAPGEPGPITRMLSEAEHTPPPVYASSASCGTECGDCFESCCTPCCANWFGSVAALYMARNEPNRLWTTYETGNNPNQLPTDAVTDWKVGGEVTIGRYFCCGAFAIEATYWGLDMLEGYSSQSISGGSVSTPLMVDGIEFAGENGTTYFDSAAQHFVRRQNEIHNVEINILGTPGVAYGSYGAMGCADCGCGSGPFTLGWNLGVRYFRFEENYLFGSVDTGRSWGEAGGIYEAYLEDNVRNNLVGFQFGCDFSYSMFGNWRLYAAPKLGIYNNHVEHYFGLRRGDGVVANPTAASGVTGTYPVSSSEDALAFMSEIDLGLDWQVAPHWSIFLGYRVIFATGIALADNQVPPYVVDIPEIADIDTNGDLILHGAFAGVTLRF